jgi:hypothetical protein
MLLGPAGQQAGSFDIGRGDGAGVHSVAFEYGKLRRLAI